MERGTSKPRGQRDSGTKKKASRPTRPCDGPRMNPSVDVGNPPRPFRHLRMAERCSPDPSSSRVPVHSALVQKSVTAITNSAGRLSGLDARTNAVDAQVTRVRKMAIHLPEAIPAIHENRWPLTLTLQSRNN